jgi:hypothetical protein
MRTDLAFAGWGWCSVCVAWREQWAWCEGLKPHIGRENGEYFFALKEKEKQAGTMCARQRKMKSGGPNKESARSI